MNSVIPIIEHLLSIIRNLYDVFILLTGNGFFTPETKSELCFSKAIPFVDSLCPEFEHFLHFFRKGYLMALLTVL